MSKIQTTHFGFQTVPLAEKTKQVADVFHAVANHYDLMNDLMSWGLHRLWKYYTVLTSGVRKGQKILDVAGGTGDLAKRFLKRVGEKGAVYLADINDSMLKIGRDKLLDQGFFHHLFYIQTNAENLAFTDNYFDGVSIGFGLRNVTHKEKALSSMQRVLKPGGSLWVLEFSHPVLPVLKKLYDNYSFSFLPKLGQWIAASEESYRYLVESIRRHPDQESLRTMILAAGFDRCEYLNLSGGIVCLHRAYKG